jgi:hypothetical protein
VWTHGLGVPANGHGSNATECIIGELSFGHDDVLSMMLFSSGSEDVSFQMTTAVDPASRHELKPFLVASMLNR